MKIISSNIKNARTLNGSFYNSKEYLKKCSIDIFEKSWQLLSDDSELIKPYSKKPVEFLDPLIPEPLFLSKEKDYSIKCFSNVCTHRANILINKPCKVKEITCKYHGRRFDNCGKLISMPEFQEVENFPSKQDDLIELPTKKWKQFIFSSINPSINFDHLIKPINDRVGWMPIENFRFDPKSSKDYFVKANWALYCDNYLEGFHIPFVHGGLNQALDYDKYSTEIQPYSVLQLGYADKRSLSFNLPKSSKDHGRKIAAYYFWLFPNMMLNFYPWGLSINIVKPIKTNLSKVEFKSYVWDESKRDSGAGSKLHKVEMEDEEIVENVQKGVKSRFYKNGKFSPTMEKGVHHFHKLISNFLVS